MSLEKMGRSVSTEGTVVIVFQSQDCGDVIFLTPVETYRASISTSAITLLMVYMALRKLYRDGGGDNSPHPRVTDWAFST